MIALVTGPPGAGKSYYCVRTIVDQLEAGKVVVTNVALVDDWAERLARANIFRRLWPGRCAKAAADFRRRLFVITDLPELFRVRVAGRGEGRAVAVLDEAHNWMNARAWNEGGRMDVVRWFTQHRKLGFDVYLITQDALNIDRQVRDLFEYHVRLKNLRKFKVGGIPLFPMNLFLAVWGWHDGAKSIVRRQMYLLNGTARLYDSMALSHGADQLDPADVIALPLPAPAPARGRAPAAVVADRGPDHGQGGSSNSRPRAKNGTRVPNTRVLIRPEPSEG